MKKLLALLLLLCVPFAFGSCDEKTVPREYCEMILYLPRAYKEKNPTESFELEFASGKLVDITLSTGKTVDKAYTNGEAIIGLTRISFVAAAEHGIPDTLSQLKFAEFYMQTTGIEQEINMHGDVPYYTYTSTDAAGNEFLFLMTFYRTKYAYFNVFYVTSKDNSENYFDIFLDYTKTHAFT